MIELLAPVGSGEALRAAIESGADAVYLAGKLFGARAYAMNFSEEELVDVVRTAHLRNVKVYVTVNTIVHDDELPALIPYLYHLYNIGVDALIVQDIGVAQIIRKATPNMPLHASTQMTIHSLAGVEYLAKMGFTRVVLARELTLAEIKHICQNSQLEIEVFVHGALCISYSGQCLMSSLIGGRSGNRGRCAQPCRLPYTLIDHNGEDALKQADAGEYLLSPKDLSGMKMLPELIQAGISSLKVEGRMKRAEYVAVVTDTYRRKIDSYYADSNAFSVGIQDEKDLAQIFNRDFTTAYWQNQPDGAMMSSRRPNNRGVRIGRVVDYQPKQKKVTIKLDEDLAIGDILDFWVKVGGRVNTTVNSMTVAGKEADLAIAGSEVTLPVTSPVRINDRVFKVFDARLMDKARRFFAGNESVKRIPIDIAVQVAEGTPLTINLKDGDGFCSSAQTSFIAEKAMKRPLTSEVILKQVERLGSTIFILHQFECNIAGEVMVPISEINEARRQAVEKLEEARLRRYARPKLQTAVPAVSLFLPEKKVQKKSARVPELALHVDQIEKVKIALEHGADVILFGGERFGHKPISLDEYAKIWEIVHKKNKKIIFSTPRIVREQQVADLLAELTFFQQIPPNAISVSNLGTLHIVRSTTDLPLHGDYPLNVYNSAAIQFMEGEGLKSITLSPELTFVQIAELSSKSKINLECIVHGYLTLMISEFCAIGGYLGKKPDKQCNSPCLSGSYKLKDRKGELFSLATDQFCRMHVLNAKELSMIPHVAKFGELGISRLRVEAKKMTLAETAEITALYRELIDKGENHPLFQSAEKLKSVEHADITRGHYFRGVM